MGGDCSNPPPGWPARYQKPPRLTSSHRSRQAPHQAYQNLQDRASPSQAGKRYLLGNCSLHCGRRSLHLRPQGTPHCQPVPIGLLLLPQVLQIHQVHRPPPDSPVTPPLEICVLHQGQSPHQGRPNLALWPINSDCSHPGKPEKHHPRWNRLSIQIRLRISLPRPIGCQDLPLSERARLQHHHPCRRLSHCSRNLLSQCFRYHLCHQRWFLLSGSNQTWICTRRHWDALSPLWGSHDHAHRGGHRLDPHGHRTMALARVHGLNSAAYLILQWRHLSKNEWATLVYAPLSNQPSTDPNQNPFHIFINPRPIRWTKQNSLSDCLNTSPSNSPINSL